MTLLRTDGLTVSRGAQPVVSDVSFAVGPQEFVGLIGPNGAGKTSLLRASLGLLPSTGTSSLAELDPKARARAAAWLPQNREIAWPVDVKSVVTLGRLPHLPRGTSMADADAEAIQRALRAMDLADMAHRRATELSGGEQARVLIARALAQETPLLMADEPISGLDPAHQFSTMQMFADLAQDGRGIVTALHDLSLAARFCTRLLLLDKGRLVADGPPEDVLTTENVAGVFRINGTFLPVDGGLQFHVLEAL
jgi:iron complex transport system ATP-binding protein